MEAHTNNNGNNIFEKEILQQFRRNLHDKLNPDVSDAVLLKFLRIKNFHLMKCERLYREHTYARRLYLSDELKNYKKPEVLQKYEFSNYLGVAKDGTPVRYIAMGRGDLKGFISSLDVIEIGKYFQFEVESDLKRCREQGKKLGKDINEVTYVVDMEQFSLRQVFFSGIIDMGLDFLQLLQDHYPELWSNILIINAPVYFETIINIFKPILRLNFLEKIYVASRERSTDLLLKYIDPEVLPAFLGGERVDSYGNLMCYEFMKFGGTVPEEYYACNRAQLLPTDPDVIDVWVPPRSYYNYTFLSMESNSIIRMEVRTEGGSLGGSILYKEFGADPEKLELPSQDECINEYKANSPWERISPFARLPTHVTPINSYCHAPWPGIYVFRYDNTYNWFSARRLILRIKVLPPGTSPL